MKQEKPAFPYELLRNEGGPFAEAPVAVRLPPMTCFMSRDLVIPWSVEAALMVGLDYMDMDVSA